SFARQESPVHFSLIHKFNQDVTHVCCSVVRATIRTSQSGRQSRGWQVRGAGRAKAGRDTPEFLLSHRAEERQQEFSSVRRSVDIGERPTKKHFHQLRPSIVP